MRTSKLLTLTLLTVWTGLTPAYGQLARSTFGVDADGWMVVDRSANTFEIIQTRGPVYTNSGGNPGGYIYISDGPGDFYFRAPAKFLGNQAAAYGYPLQFDLVSDLVNTPTQLVHSVILIGNGITNVASLPPITVSNTWTRFSVMLQTGTFWTNAVTGLPSTAPDLLNCLTALESLDIAGEFGTGLDTAGLDNVTLYGSSAPFDYSVSFDSGIADSNFYIRGETNWQAAPPGSGLAAVAEAGKLALSKRDGIGTGGGIYYISTFFLLGDFVATVSADRTALGIGTAGLVAFLAPASSSHFFDVYFHFMDRVTSVLGYPGIAEESKVIYNGATTVVFRLRRSGTSIYSEVDFGAGFVGLITNSNPAVTAPVQISLFLLEEDGSTATNHVVFDNLSVHADEVLSPLSLHGSTGNSTLDWPDGGFPCVLEATPVLGPSASWAQVTNAPTLNGWYDTLTLTPTESTRFFRLHWQSY